MSAFEFGIAGCFPFSVFTLPVFALPVFFSILQSQLLLERGAIFATVSQPQKLMLWFQYVVKLVNAMQATDLREKIELPLNPSDFMGDTTRLLGLGKTGAQRAGNA